MRESGVDVSSYVLMMRLIVYKGNSQKLQRSSQSEWDKYKWKGHS